MNLKEVLLILGVVFASAGGQILLRRGALRWVSNRGTRFFLRSVFFSEAMPALILVLGAPLLYWKALETAPLSRAYALTALTGVLVQIGAAVALKERVSRRFLAGALLCCAGIAVWGI